jgi:small subunit ribosomal protein S6
LKKYEAVYILDLRKVEDEGKAFSEEFSKKIGEMGGTVTDTVLMGRKQFAREISKRKAGIYVNFFFEMEPAQEKNLREVYRLDERILRVLIINDERPAQIRSTLAAVEPAAEEQR